MRTPLTAPEPQVYRTRHEAGLRLAKRLAGLRRLHPLVIGIAPGGVPVAAAVADELCAPLRGIALDPHPPAATGRDADVSRPADLGHTTALLIDDLLVDEELTATVACAVRDSGASHVVFAAPAVRMASALALAGWVDEIVCLENVYGEVCAGDCFEESEPPTAAEVSRLLEQRRPGPAGWRQHV